MASFVEANESKIKRKFLRLEKIKWRKSTESCKGHFKLDYNQIMKAMKDYREAIKGEPYSLQSP